MWARMNAMGERAANVSRRGFFGRICGCFLAALGVHRAVSVENLMSSGWTAGVGTWESVTLPYEARVVLDLMPTIYDGRRS